ncbi:acyl-CoA dehydrogenase family protein [Streptomyces sp. NRRL S-118]|uniref:acyl-CoA dehydrogenase family protein n=1 Tax=Streptomyces sp. NRRL S-118 TaxID=1463881 RepID=UPI0004C516B6|nr:acyl-CoA dehydrogenase family protein [Streptomyces sp. NRRL S-118]
MRFRLTDDQRALRRGVREVLERRFARDALRAAVDGGTLDRGLWRELGRAGFFALRLPEADGGAGLGLPEAVLAFEEAGRVLLPGPLVATHLAAGRIPGAARGEVVVTAVTGRLVEWLDAADVVEGDATGAEPVRSVDPLTPLHRLPADRPEAAGANRAADVADGVQVTGGAQAVDGAEVTSVMHAAGGAKVTSVTHAAGGAEVTGVAQAVKAACAAGATGAADGAHAAHLAAVLLTAAEQLGSAGRTTELAARYACVREQFGSPIGAFQAVKHLCADMLVRVEVARAAVYAAAVTGDPVDVAAAKLLADEAAVRGARDCLQVYGGMGFTWEADVHLHLKRAWVRAERGMTARVAEEVCAAALGPDAADHSV